MHSKMMMVMMMIPHLIDNYMTHDMMTQRLNTIHCTMIIWLLLKLYVCTLWRHITLSDPILAYLTTKSTISTASLANIVFHWVSQGKYCPCM